MALRTIKWRKQFRVRDDRIVWISVPKFDECWRLSEAGHHYFVRGQGRPAAYRRIEESVKNGVVLPMPHIGFYPDLRRISFTDGRHRFSWVRDHGGRDIKAATSSVRRSRAGLSGAGSSAADRRDMILPWRRWPWQRVARFWQRSGWV
jgi:hypothetical protein